MRTLDEIVTAARLNEPLEPDEARYAIVAFDVVLARLDLEKDAIRLKEWMTAALLDPQKYIGPANDPQNPEVVDWYRSMHGIGNPDHSRENRTAFDLFGGYADSDPL